MSACNSDIVRQCRIASPGSLALQPLARGSDMVQHRLAPDKKTALSQKQEQRVLDCSSGTKLGDVEPAAPCLARSAGHQQRVRRGREAGCKAGPRASQGRQAYR